jgi:ubiquitin carboxyl-terminal hydrolase 4/11
VVSRAAYLLFYRRRSDVPLGGPRFQEITEKFENAPDDEASESGEDQRLGGGSFQHGSSRLGIGAGVIHQLADRGEASTDMATTVTTHVLDDELPSYEASGGIQNSIEDEGIGMANGHSGNATLAALHTNWTWQNVNAVTNSNNTPDLGLDYESDAAQHDSSGDERDVVVQAADHESDNDTDMGVTESFGVSQPFGSSQSFGEYVEPEEPSGYQEPPAPDYNAQIGLADIQHQVWEQKQAEQVLSVPGPLDNDQASEEAAEIRLEENDAVKLD